MRFSNFIIPTLGVLSASAMNLVIANPSQAQTFTVSPLLTIADSKGGQSKNSITVTNNGKEPLRMRVYTENFTYDRQKGFVTISNHDRSAIQYLQFSPRELVVPPGVTRNIRVASTLPPSLPDGEYRVVLFLEDLKEKKLQNNANNNPVVMKARVASVFYISKGSGSADLQANAATWDTTNKRMTLVLNNKGQKSAYPNVNWKIEKDGKEITKNRVLGVVLQAGNEREIGLEMGNANLTSGNYTLSGDISVDRNKNTPFSVKVNIP
jgi:P pilus assembly chaperone PapD